MAITTYAQLQTAIATWLARTGDTIISDAAADLIKLCEGVLNYGHGEMGDPDFVPPLRVRQMELRATASASAEFLALPSDFLEMRGLKVNTDPETALVYSTPQQFAGSQAASLAGTPVTYTIIDGELRFGPVPSSALTVEMQYYKVIPALSDSSTTNWLLTLAPNIYLFGSLSQAAAYISDDTQLLKWAAMFRGAVRALQYQDRRSRHGSGPLQIRSNAATP